jgi:hypothetical protein
MNVEEKPETLGKIEHCTGFDRKQLQEIDIRVGAKLMEREMLRSEYVRGLLDCFYVLALIGGIVYYCYFLGKET